MLPDIVRRTACRVCGSADLEPILSLGPTPLANAFLRSADEFRTEPQFPLDLYFCASCSLLQLLDVVNPEVMFRHYLYVTGTSTTMGEHNERYAGAMQGRLGLGSADLAIDIASNDGSLLGSFRRRGVRTLGVEPARNLAALAADSGIETVNEFLTEDVARTIVASHGQARVVSANNVLAHVDDPAAFLRACRMLVSDDGLITVEVPHVQDLVDRLEYDTVYHEHLSYFSATSLLKLCERVNLAVVEIEHIPVHGGSLRVYASASAPRHAPGAIAFAESEREAGIAGVDRYRRFAKDVQQHRDNLRALLQRLVAGGRRLAGYGAPAKGNTLLNYCGIDTSLLPFTVDKNPLKIGLLTPGMHIPVRPVTALVDGAESPEFVLILAWNFADEIIDQQRTYRERGGRFILPIPEPRVA